MGPECKTKEGLLFFSEKPKTAPSASGKTYLLEKMLSSTPNPQPVNTPSPEVPRKSPVNESRVVFLVAEESPTESRDNPQRRESDACSDAGTYVVDRDEDDLLEARLKIDQVSHLVFACGRTPHGAWNSTLGYLGQDPVSVTPFGVCHPSSLMVCLSEGCIWRQHQFFTHFRYSEWIVSPKNGTMAKITIVIAPLLRNHHQPRAIPSP